MFRCFLIYTLSFIIVTTSAVHEKKIQRLVGGHLRIHPYTQDTELLIPLASGNKKNQKIPEDEKKTLSQQVADGKYGLIQKELFDKPSKRPGVISYDINSEVPKDTINNLRGLSKDDIWLAENHLLVIKGGIYPAHDKTQENSAPIWPAIDNYKAPHRQVKIPPHPKIPPPFPVQLTDDGPLQILGTNSSRTINGTLEEADFFISPPEDINPNTYLPPPTHSNTSNATSGQAPIPIPAYPSGEYLPGSPFPPKNLSGTLPPFFASLPPGAAILPPPNPTEPFDEDDPSIYYPPPYSFYYPQDNSSVVPPGPLVPGIVLPPPPNFFGILEETTTKKPRTTRKPIRHKITTPSHKIYTTIKEISQTPPINRTTKIKTLPVQVVKDIVDEFNPSVTTDSPNVVTILSVKSKVNKNRTVEPRLNKNRPTVTILKPIQTTDEKAQNHQSDKNYSYQTSYNPNAVISTTKVPLKIYFSTSKDIETNSIAHSIENYNIQQRKVTRPTAKPPTKYYYYEEPPSKETVTTKPVNSVPREFYLPSKQVQQKPAEQQKYIFVQSQPYNTQRPRYRFVKTPAPDTFSVHIAKLQKQIDQYYTTSRSVQKTVNFSKPLYQFSFEATNYRKREKDEDSQNKFQPLPKYSVQIQPAVEIFPKSLSNTENPSRTKYYQAATRTPPRSNQYQSEKPTYKYQYLNEEVKGVVTPRPIDQYSFEVTPHTLYQNFYIKPEENTFDENTRHYFTTFGQKIKSTTPITPTYQQQTRNNYYKQEPVSLHRDTIINYLPSRPQINPNAELVQISPFQQKITYPHSNVAPYEQESRKQHQNIQIAQSVPVNVRTQKDQGSFISYQLPGDDGAHFYFLTPQLIQSRNQGAGYYYSKENVYRQRRRNKKR